jgi:hypothetical protein
VPPAVRFLIDSQIYIKTCLIHQKREKVAKYYKIFCKKFGGIDFLATFAIPNEKKTFEKQIPE